MRIFAHMVVFGRVFLVILFLFGTLAASSRGQADDFEPMGDNVLRSQGGYIVSQNPGRLFMDEITLWGTRTQATGNTNIGFLNGQWETAQYDGEITNIGVERIYRLAGRFLHREIPFFLNPFNYRESYMSTSAGFSRISEEVETRISDPSSSSTFRRLAFPLDNYLAFVGGRVYAEEFYVGGSAAYSLSIRSVFDSEEHFHAQNFSMEGGFHDPYVQGGVRLNTSSGDYSDFTKDVLSTATFWITPTPFILIRGMTAQILNGPREDLNHVSNSLGAVYVMQGPWWEFGARADTYSPYDYYDSVTGTFHVGKYLKNLFVKCSYDYTETDTGVEKDISTGVSGTLRYRWPPSAQFLVSFSRTRLNMEDLTESARDAYWPNEVVSFERTETEYTLHLQVSFLF